MFRVFVPLLTIINRKNDRALVLFRCIGDLSKLECKDTRNSGKWLQDGNSGDTCVRDPKRAQKSLLNSATAFDSYVGYIAASWVVFFTRNDRETHIVGSMRQFLAHKFSTLNFCYHMHLTTVI